MLRQAEDNDRIDKVAFAEELALAHSGHAESQYRVGERYLVGKGIIQDDTQAAHWYYQATLQGHHNAHRRFRAMQERGRAHLQLHVSYRINRKDLEIFETLFTSPGASIYRGRYQSSPVAIKHLKREHLRSEAALEDFECEVKIMASLHSPYVVTLYGYCIEPPYPYYIVMEYMPKGSLRDALKSSSGVFLTWGLKMRIGYEICAGVAYLHAAGFIHRDIRAANILLTEECHAKISDFGISSTIKENPSATLLKEVLGTPPWMAPELFVNNPDEPPRCTPKTDSFSVGMTLWELVTGNQPCSDLPWGSYDNDITSHKAVAERRQRGILEKPPQDCPWKIRHLIRACLNIDPKQRPAASEMVHFLEESNQLGFESFLPAYRSQQKQQQEAKQLKLEAAEQAAACQEKPASPKR